MRAGARLEETEMIFDYTSFVSAKEKLAREIAVGAGGGEYVDGVILLCVAISAMSSVFWTEDRSKDAKRFVEIVATSGNAGGVDPKTISAPLLAQSSSAWAGAVDVTGIAFSLTSDHDLSEAQALQVHPDANKPRDQQIREVRRYSYAYLLYKEIRNGLIHAYKPGESASIYDGVRNIERIGKYKISYSNDVSGPNFPAITRRIHFSIDLIAEVARNIASKLDAECERQGKYIGENLGLSYPTPWWIDGG
jgi:hypothetical protein